MKLTMPYFYDFEAQDKATTEEHELKVWLCSEI